MTNLPNSTRAAIEQGITVSDVKAERLAKLESALREIAEFDFPKWIMSGLEFDYVPDLTHEALRHLMRVARQALEVQPHE